MIIDSFTAETQRVRRENIRKGLKAWYARAKRDLPWRGSKEAYPVWVSEIMLQQTRVTAVIPYYEKFLARFPTVEALAAAPERELLTCWSGLGYYSRARNLQKAAKSIAESGGFPSDYESIRSLPGVGDYTAAAIASIVYDLPYAVLDGNVLRVLSRLTNDSGDIASGGTKKRLQSVASDLLDRKRPGDFNQAMMELGATVCLPKQPQCLLCPLREHCEAWRVGSQNELPVKLRRKKAVDIEEIVLILEKDGKILLRQRGQAEAWLPGFWDLPILRDIPGATLGRPAGTFRHSITHHNYVFSVIKASVQRAPEMFQWVSRTSLDEIPLTTITKKSLRLINL